MLSIEKPEIKLHKNLKKKNYVPFFYLLHPFGWRLESRNLE